MRVGNYTSISNSYQNNTNGAVEYKSVREYSNYLSNKYACLTPGKNTSVSVTSGLLRKAMNDEKTGEWLEKELSKAPDYIKQAQQSASARGSKLVSASIEFGEEYTTMYVCTVTDTPETNSAIEKWLDQIKENKEELKNTERPTKQLAKKANDPVTRQFQGKDLDDLMQNMLCSMHQNPDSSNLIGKINIRV